MRQLVTWIVLLGLAGVAAAGDEATDTPIPPEVAAKAAKAAKLDAKITSLAKGLSGTDWLVGLEDGSVARINADGKSTWQATATKDAVREVHAASTGKHVAASSTKELVLIDVATSKVLWRTDAPVAFGFNADGSQVLAISTNKGVSTLAVETGKQLTQTQFSDKRAVEAAVLSPDGSTAVLGVNDG